jgi:hypothetical protein
LEVKKVAIGVAEVLKKIGREDVREDEVAEL